MAYTKTTWVNGETPINADNLNNIENGIETNTNDINALNTNLNKIEDGIETNNKKLSQVITGNATINSTYINYVENNTWERIGKVVVYHFTLRVTGTWDNRTKFLTNLPKPISYTRFIALDTSSNEPIRVGIDTDGSASNAWSAVTPGSGDLIEGIVTYITSD